ncbi:hypothetical protein [Streptomyces sp. NBC_00038]|uniref:hypothetical protein n=1 Tax=Streptomyces sp. NBC_00038 TaxID=2903615 RepID=UPI00225592B9|nr:hypothetical protein [Streptomyces sp. NBC_00038]MCX5561134.1 hypothetical protein [Streptomyces sp. NBC_00038]
MLALRLARGAHPLVQLRRLLVTAASAGTGFLLLCTLGYAMAHPDASAASVLRLIWCVAPLAATVYFAVAVARTDPGTRPRPGLSAIGLGPGRLMAISAVTTALSTTLGSMLALLFFLHLRGDLTGMPFDGAAAEFLAADRPLPLPGALTLLALVPLAASVASAVVLRPQGATAGRGIAWLTARAGVVGSAPARGARRTPRHAGGARATLRTPGAHDGSSAEEGAEAYDQNGGGYDGSSTPGTVAAAFEHSATHGDLSPYDGDGPDSHEAPHGSGRPARLGHQGTPTHDLSLPQLPPVPQTAPGGLPWGAATLAAGLAVETYASRSGPAPGLALPGAFAGGPVGVLVGWAMTAVGLALAGPAITYACGRLLQAVRPGALRLLAGRVLQAEARRIGQPLGVVCAVASGGYAMATLYTGARPDFGPLTTLGVLVVAGCTVLTLATAAVEARQARADTTAALLRMGAPVTMLRSAAALRVGALLAAFGPLTWAVTELAALPLVH